MASALEDGASFMNVKQVASYLQLNEKKVYALVSDGQIPATRVTGKWMFPRELIDRWMLNSAHGGLMADRLIVAGGDDPLLNRILSRCAEEAAGHALISHAPVATRLGLELLDARRADVCGLHWGPEEESGLRHPALLRQYESHRRWVLVHAFRREQGLLINRVVADDISNARHLLSSPHAWALRQNGAGSQRYLLDVLARHDLRVEDLRRATTALSEREAAAAVGSGLAVVAPGTRAAAREFGLGFVACGWESFDFALPRDIWFRRLFQNLLACLKAEPARSLAIALGGYDLRDSGALLWGDE